MLRRTLKVIKSPLLVLLHSLTVEIAQPENILSFGIASVSGILVISSNPIDVG